MYVHLYLLNEAVQVYIRPHCYILHICDAQIFMRNQQRYIYKLRKWIQK